MRIDELTPSMTVADISVPSLRPPATTLAPLLTASLIRAWMRAAASAPISDPSGVLPLRGSPATSDPALAASFATKASATFSSTTRRSVDMQIWPWFMKAPNAAAATAASISASSSTIIGALPPSSSKAGLRYFAATCAMMRPTRVEPVKLTRRTAGWPISISIRAGASSGALVMTLRTPGGRPASRRHSAISRCVPGQISEAFSTTVLPQASGSAMARTPRMTGAFHGAMLSTTPAGWRTAIAMQPGLSEGMTSPEICVVIDGGLAQHAGGEVDVEAGPAGGRAGFGRHQLDELRRLRRQQIGGLQQDRAAGIRAGGGPGREGGGGGVGRPLCIRDLGRGGAAGDVAGDGVEAIEGRAVRCRDILALEQQRDFVHGFLLRAERYDDGAAAGSAPPR